MKFNSLGVSAVTIAHPLGLGVDSLWSAVANNETGLCPNPLDWCDLPCWIGAVPGVDDANLSRVLGSWDCRNHRLAWMAIQLESFSKAVASAIRRVGASRIGLVLGTSTSGIRSTEIAYAYRKRQGEWPEEYNYRHSHSIDALCRFVGEILNVQGPMTGVATACSSSAKAFLVAQRWIQAGLIDAAIVGGVDSLCLSTLHGFNSLQLLSEHACRPFDAARNGISIGEAAGFALLENAPGELQFVGGGESSDAWHMSSPHPEGAGAQQAIHAALAAAQLAPSDIGYVNAHGTATPANDYAEALALQAVFGTHGVPVSSTKGITGHALGAAGIVDAIIAMTALRRQVLAPSANLLTPDPRIELALVTEPRPADLHYVMSNNFGFSGSNCSLIFGRGS
jgi:3-oxoacyl-[acyl-carrier-protein] synthase-1